MSLRPPSDAGEGGRGASGSASLLVVFAAISFQTGSALAVKVVESVGVVEAAWLKNAIGALLLASFTMAWRRDRLRLPPRGHRRALAGLTLSMLAMTLGFYGAIQYAPVGVVVAIVFLGPLAVAVAGTRRRVDWLWIALAGAGVALLAGPTSSVDPLGLLLALAAGASFATYLVLGKRVVTGLAPLTTATLMLCGAALLLTPLLAVGGLSIVGHGRVIALAAVVALLSAALPFVLEFTALRRVPVATYGVLICIEPAIAALAGFILLGQRLSVTEIMAIGPVTIGAVGASWTSGASGLAVDVPVA